MWGEAVRGLTRVQGSVGTRPLVHGLVTYRGSPLALLAAIARRDRGGIAWRDGSGTLTYGEVVAELRTRGHGSGPVLVRATDPREVVLDTLAAVCAGRPVAVLGARGGSLAAEVPRGRGVMFLTTGTTGVPRAHASGGGVRALLPYLGLIGRLPHLPRPVVGSPSPPDHGHAFLLVLITWSLAGTYVQLTGPVGPLDVLSGVPLQLADTLDRGWCSAARHVVSGSDVLGSELAGRLRRELGAQVWDAYGATETGPISLGTPPDVVAGTVGRPLPGVRVRAESGVLVVRTPATAREFRGDRGIVDRQGRLVLSGRNDGRVVSGGEVVDPERLRRWLATQPGVQTVAVRSVPDPRFGTRLAAQLTGQVGDVASLRERIRAELGPAHVPVTLDLDVHDTEDGGISASD